MLFDSFLSLVWDGSILCRFVEAYSVTQHVAADQNAVGHHITHDKKGHEHARQRKPQLPRNCEMLAKNRVRRTHRKAQNGLTSGRGRFSVCYFNELFGLQLKVRLD